MYIAIYLLAIVLANLSVTHFGPVAMPINAFLFIGLDLTMRDRLHMQWQGRGLFWRMGLLIAAGGAISYALNAGAGRIALASCVAFVLAAAADSVAFHLLRRRPWFQRVNGSNVAGAVVDSFVFPTLAFGAFLPWVTLAQIVAKIAGGALWAWVLNRQHQQVVFAAQEAAGQ